MTPPRVRFPAASNSFGGSFFQGFSSKTPDALSLNLKIIRPLEFRFHGGFSRGNCVLYFSLASLLLRRFVKLLHLQ